MTMAKFRSIYIDYGSINPWMGSLIVITYKDRGGVVESDVARLLESEVADLTRSGGL